MESMIVDMDSIKSPIQPSPGFYKKGLADAKLDICGLCGFGCRYCSSNSGNYQRINRKKFDAITQEQLHRQATPSDTPGLMYLWTNVIENLEAQIKARKKPMGQGETLVFSMLTDGFSPELLRNGTTKKALDLVLEHTKYRIRVLTKNAIVGNPEWTEYFSSHPDRFVVGLSAGTLDNQWAKRVEIGTSLPTARLRATQNLQEKGVPTYGMLCPIFPDMLGNDSLPILIDRVNPSVAEHIWAEPYNDRDNWEHVRDGYQPESVGYQRIVAIYGTESGVEWSRYATDLYLQLREHAESHGWLPKLRYLLYEDLITEADAARLGDMAGIWLQSNPGTNGLSKNPHIAARQPDSLAVKRDK